MRLTIVLFLLAAGCGGVPKAPERQETRVAPVALSAADLAQVCRAAIGAVNGHSPDIIRVLNSDSKVARVEYARPSDGKAWTNECRTAGDRIIWRTVDVFGPASGLGRWRSDETDERMLFRLSGDQVTITTTYSDGSGETESFALK